MLVFIVLTDTSGVDVFSSFFFLFSSTHKQDKRNKKLPVNSKDAHYFLCKRNKKNFRGEKKTVIEIGEISLLAYSPK